jgi:diphthamide biosynthesis enzyme Dph1/Dph2-like protein
LSSNPVVTICCFISDGRFHMESTMISNPHIDMYYRYNPYTRTMTIEQYGTFPVSMRLLCSVGEK